MPIIKVAADGLLYTVSPDDKSPLGAQIWALVRARLVDEITLEPPRTVITIKSKNPRVSASVRSDGIVGLVGIPRNVFPNLSAQNYNIDITLLVERYVDRSLELTIPMNAGFPDVFTTTDVGNIPLHREPVIIKGRTVVSSGTTTTPISGAAVRITGLWRTFPSANVSIPADPPNLISLRPPLYFPRANVTANVRRRNVTPILGQDKHLIGQAFQGSKIIRLSDRINLNPGDILRIDFDNPFLLEYLVIDKIVGASTADQPADIHLIYPVIYTHRIQSVVGKVTLQAPGPNNSFAQDALAGDSCTFLSGLTGLTTSDVAEVIGGADPPEYHTIFRFSSVSDSDGFYELPPLSRVAILEIEADDGGGQVITQTFSPDYRLTDNFLDFVFV